MKVAIINYGMGNLASVRRAFEDIGAESFVAEHSSALYSSDCVVLPGVGAFTEGMDRLREGGWIDAINDVVTQQGKRFLGICLGMQMLASEGEEGGFSQGLGLIPGRVMRLDKIGCTDRIPHVGWNEVAYRQSDPHFARIPDGSDFYFVHSYVFVPQNQDHLLATASYGVDIPAVVRNGQVIGCQFHPEKSSKAGRQMLRNFLEPVPC